MTFHRAKPHKGSPVKAADMSTMRGNGGSTFSYDPRPDSEKNKGAANWHRIQNGLINFACKVSTHHSS